MARSTVSRWVRFASKQKNRTVQKYRPLTHGTRLSATELEARGRWMRRTAARAEVRGEDGPAQCGRAHLAGRAAHLSPRLGFSVRRERFVRKRWGMRRLAREWRGRRAGLTEDGPTAELRPERRCGPWRTKAACSPRATVVLTTGKRSPDAPRGSGPGVRPSWRAPRARFTGAHPARSPSHSGDSRLNVALGPLSSSRGKRESVSLRQTFVCCFRNHAFPFAPKIRTLRTECQRKITRKG